MTKHLEIFSEVAKLALKWRDAERSAGAHTDAKELMAGIKHADSLWSELGIAIIDALEKVSKLPNRSPTGTDDLHGQRSYPTMSLEQALAANTAALEALTAQLKSGGAAASSSKPAADKPAASTKPKAGAHTKAEAQAAMEEVKEKFGTPAAVELRNKYGKVAKMAELTDPAAIDALYDACKAKLAEDEGGESNGDGL